MKALPATFSGRLPRVFRNSAASGTRTIVALTVLLWVACFVFCYALLTTPVRGDNLGMIMLTESYGALERVALWQRATSWLPGGHPDGTFAEWPRWAVAWTVRVSFAAMFILHAVAFFAAWVSRSASNTMPRWLIGPIGAQAIMLLMVPTNADVFFYAISGDIAGQGLNPYTTHLYEAFQSPLYPYNHWVEMTTVYGPIWTMFNQALISIIGNDPTTTVLVYKILFGLVLIVLAAGTYLASRLLGIARHHAAAAMVLVAWQPNMLVESAGQAHTDPLITGIVLAAITLTIVGASSATRGGVLLTTLSAAIKYISLPVLGLLALTRLDRHRQQHGTVRILLAWTFDLIAIGIVLYLAFRPYWAGVSTLTEMFSEPGRLFSHPAWFIPRGIIEAVFSREVADVYRGITRIVLQVISVIAIMAVIVRFGMYVWKHAGTPNTHNGTLPYWTRQLVAGWAAIFSILAFVPANVHPWYWTWPVVPIALLVAYDADDQAQRPPHRWFVPYLILTAVLTLIYHTRIVRY